MEPVCNIDLKGIAQRKKIVRLQVSLIALASLLNLANAKFKLDFFADNNHPGRRYALWFAIEALSVATVITHSQIAEKTCVMHGVLGTQEEGPDSLKAIKVQDKKKAEILFWRSVKMLGRGAVIGNVAAAVLCFGPYLLFNNGSLQ